MFFQPYFVLIPTGKFYTSTCDQSQFILILARATKEQESLNHHSILHVHNTSNKEFED